jgi:hypothetical protein
MMHASSIFEKTVLFQSLFVNADSCVDEKTGRYFEIVKFLETLRRDLTRTRNCVIIIYLYDDGGEAFAEYESHRLIAAVRK